MHDVVDRGQAARRCARLECIHRLTGIHRFAELQEPFSDLVLEAALEIAWIEGAPKLMIIHGRGSDRAVLENHADTHRGWGIARWERVS